MPTNLTLIHQLEINANAAMPALETYSQEGWLLRVANGYTKRANSVHPLEAIQRPLEEAVATCETFYRTRQLPPIFKLTEASQPPHLDAYLAQRGYALNSPTLVQTCSLTDITLEETLTGTTHLSEAWLTTYHTLDPIKAAFHETFYAMLTQCPSPTWYAALSDETGRCVAIGLAVHQGSLAGIFNILVDPTQRRRGLGRQIMLMLLSWARQQGAQQAYLQVSEDNHSAISLYQSLGFETAYRYWYRLLKA